VLLTCRPLPTIAKARILGHSSRTSKNFSADKVFNLQRQVAQQLLFLLQRNSGIRGERAQGGAATAA
jgi:hypothetical protein